MLTLPLGLRGRFVLSLAVGCLVTLLSWTRWRSSPEAMDALASFWLADLPPLTGVTRIYIYAGLLVTALTSFWARPHLGDSPLQAPELFAYTLPAFFSKEGAMKFLYSSRWVNVPMLTLIRNTTLLAFACCILGFGGQVPPVIVGVGMLLLHGVVQGCIGTSHRWYVPVYTCLALALANGNGDLSVDAWASEKWGSAYPFAPVCPASGGVLPLSLLCSGYARKMVLLAGISTLFFGAITKFLNSGFAWLDGAPLSYYVSSEENGRSAFLKNLMAQHQWIAMLLSFGSIGLEAGSIVAVFVPWTRALVLVSAAGLHLGIWLTMWPNYFPQTWCYALGILWPLGVEPTWSDLVATSGATSAARLFDLDSRSVQLALWSGVFLWSVLTMVALTRIEWWPLTGIPMYSLYRDHSYSYRHLRDASQAQGVALEHAQSGYPNALAWSNLWITLRLRNMDPALRREKELQKESKARLQQKGKGEERLDSASPSPARAAAAGSSFSIGPASAVGGRKSVESSGLLSSEREFVNLKSRVTERAYTRNGRKGVYLKQWRRTLHNVAAADMAAKPWGQIEAPPLDDQLSADQQQQQVYPALAWLRLQLPHLRHWSRANEWALPSWADEHGELQLRAKLRDRYAILARIPWRGDGALPGSLDEAQHIDAALEAIRAAGVDTSSSPRDREQDQEGEEEVKRADWPQQGDDPAASSRSRVRKGRSVVDTAAAEEPASPRVASPAGRWRSPRSGGGATSSKKKKSK